MPYFLIAFETLHMLLKFIRRFHSDISLLEGCEEFFLLFCTLWNLLLPTTTRSCNFKWYRKRWEVFILENEIDKVKQEINVTVNNSSGSKRSWVVFCNILITSPTWLAVSNSSSFICSFTNNFYSSKWLSHWVVLKSTFKIIWKLKSLALQSPWK